MRQFILDGLYTYTNVILLGMFAGCVWYVVRLMRCPKDVPWHTTWQHLNQEHWLFGSWGIQIRNKLAPWLFYVAIAIYQFEIFFVNSLYRTRLPFLYETGTIALNHILALCLLAKILFTTKYSAWQTTVQFCVFFIMRWVFFNNHIQWVMMSVLFFMAAKDIPLRKALTVCFTVGTASVVVVALSSCVGIIDTLYDLETSRTRNSFGYGWFNYFGACLLGLGLMYVCLRRLHRCKWYDFAVLLALAVFSDLGPDSRATSICLFLLVGVLFVMQVAPKFFQLLWVRVLASLAPLVALAASVLIAMNWDPQSGFMTSLNRILSGRVELSWMALNEMPFRIAGQMRSPDMLVDNAYVQHWILSGPVASLLMWVAFSLLIWRLLAQKHLTEAACCLVILCHGLMEIHITWACVNVMLWLLCGVLYWPKEQPCFAAKSDAKAFKKEKLQ